MNTIARRATAKDDAEKTSGRALLRDRYAAPIARRCWKHSRQNTGRPCVGRKGTVVSFPHCEQLVLVSERTGPEFPPVASARLALQDLQRFGSFLKPLSAKNICSPAVKTNSAPHSAHFRTLSWYSIRCSGCLFAQEKQRHTFEAAVRSASVCTRGRHFPAGSKLHGTIGLVRFPSLAHAAAFFGGAYARELP